MTAALVAKEVFEGRPSGGTLTRFASLATLPRSAGSPARAIGDENAYHFAGSFRGAGSAREPTGRPGMTILP